MNARPQLTQLLQGRCTCLGCEARTIQSSVAKLPSHDAYNTVAASQKKKGTLYVRTTIMMEMAELAAHMP